MSDEVYGFLTFDEKEHTLFANIGSNYNKTITIFSGGKLFSATGWGVGWAIAPSEILKRGGIISNSVYYATNSMA